MNFIIPPPDNFLLRTDNAMVLKNNSSDILIKLSRYGQLVVRLGLEKSTSQCHRRHFHKLFDAKKEVEYIQRNMVEPGEFKLDFIRLKKSKFKEAQTRLREWFPEEDTKQLLQKNIDCLILELTLFDPNEHIVIDVLRHQIYLKPDLKHLSIIHWTPKKFGIEPITDVLVVLKKQYQGKCEDLYVEIRNDGEITQIRVDSFKTGSKVVLGFRLERCKFPTGKFEARILINKNVFSDWRFLENTGMIETPHIECGSLGPPPVVSSCIGTNVPVNLALQEKCTNNKLREFSRLGHDFAFGQQLTDTQIELLEKIPLLLTLKDNVGDTPLNNAILKSREDRADTILDIIPQDCLTKLVNETNSSGHTALMLACAFSSGKGMSSDFIMRLVQAGADMMLHDCLGDSCFSVAIQYDNWDLFRLLIELGFYQNIPKDKMLDLLWTKVDLKDMEKCHTIVDFCSNNMFNIEDLLVD